MTAGDLEEIWALAERNQEHLARWMPWAVDLRREETESWLRGALEQQARDDGFHACILDGGRIAGQIGFHAIDRRNRSTTLGYWLAAGAQGRGTMTAAVRAMVGHAFGAWGLHRVELHAAVANTRSRAVAERAGFTAEGVLRQAEWFPDRYEDLVVYGIIASDPSAPSAPGTG